MRKHRWLRMAAVFSALVLVAAACGDDDDDDDAAPTDGTEAPDGDGGLVIGQIGPETGPLAFLGPPQFAGFELAIEDINAAGGVLGSPVQTLSGDEAGDEARARDAANRLIGEGAHVIVGAAASGMTQAFIQLLFDNEIVQCSPSNTSPVFSDQDNAAFYHRTVPPDEAVSPIIADEVIADGHTRVAIAARADDYGNALGELIQGALEEQGATVELISYDPNAASFSDVVQQIADFGPDAVVLVSFDEGAQIISGALEAGIGADVMYGADGIFTPTLPGLVSEGDPNVLDGMKLIGASGGAEFNERLNDSLPEGEKGNFIYGGQAYDCAVVIALAVEAAGSTDGAAVVEEMANVTKDGTQCATFAECKDLLDAGEDIDYDGVSGPLELDDVGDPQFGRYAIAQFQDGALVAIDEQDVDLTTL